MFSKNQDLSCGYFLHKGGCYPKKETESLNPNSAHFPKEKTPQCYPFLTRCSADRPSYLVTGTVDFKNTLLQSIIREMQKNNNYQVKGTK